MELQKEPNSNKKSNRVVLFNVASTIILQGLAFFSGPVFSNILGTDNYGIASVYLTWVQLASTVFSLQAASTIAVARINYHEKDQLKFQSSVLCLATISYLGFSLLAFIVAQIISKWIYININMVLLGLMHGWGLYCVSFANNKFTYEFKPEKNFILSVTVSALNIGLSILLINAFSKENNYWGRIIGQTVVYTSVGIFILVRTITSGKTIYNKEYWTFTLPIAIPTIFHLLANIILNQSDKVMIQGMISNSAAGIYSLACVFGAVLQTVWHALNNSWVPFYYEYTRQNQNMEMKKHAQNYIELFTIITIGFILLSRDVFHIYAKESFWEGTDLIPLFSVGYYFVFLYSFPVNYEFYNKKTKVIAVGTVVAAVCNICLNYFFIKLCGILGAVIATAISHGLQFGFHYLSAKRINPGEFPFRIIEFIPGVLAITCTCIVYWFTRELWPIRWIVGSILGCYLLIRIIRRREIF